MAVGAALAVERLHVFPGHAADGDDAFHRSGVRELRKPGDDIADGIEMRLGGFQIRVGVDESALELGFCFLEAAIFGERAAAHGDQNFFGGDGLRFSGFVLERDGGALARLSSRTRLWLPFRCGCLFS